MKIEIVPGPQEIISRRGKFHFPIGTAGKESCFIISDEAARIPAELIAERFKLAKRCARTQIVSEQQTAGIPIRLNILKELDFARKLRVDQRIEAYRLEVSANGMDISALTAEGLLRGAATLFQITCIKNGRAVVPYTVINDWPNFRYRCAADWLINVECNRWAYDRGDGRAAFLERIKHKLDFCFEYKINMVWFDGFGWDTKRFPGYASMMQECNRYARRLGIKLEFGGYGGGYGTAYQSGEIYRCGYFGKVCLNRRPYPDGKEYACRGWTTGFGEGNGKSRYYGTCFSNMPLRKAKIEEMQQFVAAVNPGFMYIHDIDASTWLRSIATWKNRCAACRKRWPNDDLAAADGQAGACASWFRQVRRALSAVPATGDYIPARDLTVIFAGPTYTEYIEKKPQNVWELEMRYYDKLSRLIGPEPGVEFALREQFYDTKNRKKIGRLHKLLEQNGNGHGLLVSAFGGGDNYISDDLTNITGALAHFYDGAESLYLPNGGMHQEPAQMMNADFLWSGSAGGYRENPADETAAVTIFKTIAYRAHKPSEIFKVGGYFDRLCVRLWGKAAGKLMSRALQSREHEQFPVSYVWWTITQPLAKLNIPPDAPAWTMINNFQDRALATAVALKYARKAATLSDNADIHWFVKCLEVGKQYAEAMDWLFRLKLGNDQTARVQLRRVISNLEIYIRKNFGLKKTDILGGDPGCWQDTIAEIKRLAKSFVEQQKNGHIFSDYIFKWRVSRAMPATNKLAQLTYPGHQSARQFTPRIFPAAFCEVHDDLAAGAMDDVVVFLASRVNCAKPMELELRLGYDGPVKAWLDGRQVLHDPHGTNPARIDTAIIPWKAGRGNHELMIALSANKGKAYGIYARFYRQHVGNRRQQLGIDNCTMLTISV